MCPSRSDNGRVERLVVEVAQPLVLDGDLAGNVERHASMVRATSARLVVFPELSLTGYRLDADVVDPDDRRLGPLVAACGTADAVALVGAPTTGERGRDHLSVLAVDGDGARVVYHKLYLGGDEPDRFEPGSEPTVLDVDGWRLGLAVCRDTGVAEHAARTAALGIDGYVAGVCEHAADEAIIAERAGRIVADHGVWVAVASFAGTTGHGYEPAAGCSGLWDPGGHVADRAGPDVGGRAVAGFGRRRRHRSS